MTNTYGSLLIAILIASSACLATESAQSQPQVATITGEIRDPTSREITFSYESPSALEDSEQRVVLDSLNRFSFELPVVRGTLVRAYYNEARSIFFVEPGDSLHVVVEEGFSDSSHSFRGPGADNNRFVVEWMSEFGRPSLDYEGLEVEDFKRQVDQRRRDQFEFLAERSKEYALSLGFIDYATAQFNYEWARLMISYPTNYYFANGQDNRDLPPKYYDFLQEIPLVDEKAIGTMDYHTFLVRTLDWESRERRDEAGPFGRPSRAIGRLPRDRGELDKMPSPFRRPNLSEIYDLADLGLSEETLAQLDALYEKEDRGFKLSQMVNLSAVGLLSAAQVRLDSMYKRKRLPKLSQSFDLSVFGLSGADQARIDSLHEKSKSYSFSTSNNVEEARVDTTDGVLAFYLPLEIKMDSLKKEPPKLSEKLDLSWLSEAARAQLDSMYEHRQPLKLSERIDLSSLGLSGAVQAQLDSMTTGNRTLKTWSSFSARYDLAEEKLAGRVLYWFLAGEVIRGFKRDSASFEFAQRKWEEFQENNPHLEYTEAVQAALYKALKLQPGQPAPEFTLHDLDGQPVSLNQFKGQVVLLDFWASWCGPCIGDLPALRAIKEKAADQPLVFLNLSLDTDEAAWREAIDKHEIEGVHVRADGWGADVAKSYQVNSLPSYYLVDSQGLIVERLRIMSNTDEIVATIEKSL